MPNNLHTWHQIVTVDDQQTFESFIYSVSIQIFQEAVINIELDYNIYRGNKKDERDGAEYTGSDFRHLYSSDVCGRRDRGRRIEEDLQNAIQFLDSLCLTDVKFLSKDQKKPPTIRNVSVLVPLCSITERSLGKSGLHIDTVLDVKVHSWRLTVSYAP